MTARYTVIPVSKTTTIDGYAIFDNVTGQEVIRLEGQRFFASRDFAEIEADRLNRGHERATQP